MYTRIPIIEASAHGTRRLTSNEKEVVSAAQYIRSEDLKNPKFRFPSALNLFFSTFQVGESIQS